MRELDLPDTQLVNGARRILERAAPSTLVRHSIRAYLLGSAYARKKGIAFDEEGLALAALFHDVGLTPELSDSSRPFTFASSKALRMYLEERGVPNERIAVLADAIEQHMQLLPRFSRGPEVGLLQVGAWMDVTVGPGAWKALRGKGGVRCEPLDDGVLQVGPVAVTIEH